MWKRNPDRFKKKSRPVLKKNSTDRLNRKQVRLGFERCMGMYTTTSQTCVRLVSGENASARVRERGGWSNIVYGSEEVGIGLVAPDKVSEPDTDRF